MKYCHWARIAALLIVASLLVRPVVAGEIYKWVDEHGRVQYSDRAPEQGNPGAAEQITIQANINTFEGTEVSVSDFLQTTQQARQEQAKNQRKVVMYSTSWCGVCKKARNYFATNNIAFQEHDVERSERGRDDYARLKGRGVPIIFVGRQRMDGFSPARFKQIYSY